MTAVSGMTCFPRAANGEFQMEGSAFSGLALHADLPRVLLNDAVGYGESQSGTSSLAFLDGVLSCEKWIVNAGNMFLRNTGAGVRDAHHHGVSVLRGHL